MPELAWVDTGTPQAMLASVHMVGWWHGERHSETWQGVRVHLTLSCPSATKAI